MKTINSAIEWQLTLKNFGPRSIGFVPTMGALHAGHAALLERCRAENDISVLSIFVNPTQFDNKEDLQKYPVTYAEDCKIAEQAGVDYIFLPNYKELYPDNYRYRVSENSFSQTLCGAHRPGHFDGVLTVVMKLLNIIDADRAYFGEKDYQQLNLVQGMVEAFFMKVEIVPCATRRENDGLAMSSRNRRLSPIDRERSVLFAQLLKSSESPPAIRDELNKAGFEVDYIEDIGGRRFGAVKIGGVRLIDNVER